MSETQFANFDKENEMEFLPLYHEIKRESME